ncbi:MAG: beta-lactamase family protein [Saccharofermentans sp.]|nr:beta-lactamase family protein [Saccharofermentans sp.]
MKTLKKSLALAVAALMTLSFLASCSATPPVEQEPKIYTGSYEEKIDSFYEDHKDTTAGAMVGVFDKDGVLFKGYYGYSDIENGIKTDEDTVIDWGSTTKTLVWISVMQLWEQGKIDLETDVREYLPDGFLTNIRYDKPVRMTDLMNHRAGFQEYYTDMFLPASMEAYTLEEALKLDQPAQVFEPDTITAYSNWGVALAGFIVERISGESFADYVHHHIFEPLDMNDSALAPDLSDNPGVRERRDKLMCYSGTTPVGNAFYLISLYPAGSCVSTLDDYIKYASCFVMDEFPLFEDPETFDVMMSATSYYGDTVVAKNAHGFWALPYGNNTFGHGGNTQACSSYITFDPEKQIGCVVMTNQAGETDYNGELFLSIYGRSAWQIYPDADYAQGMYHPARTVLEGRFKIMGASYVTPDTFSEFLWTYNEKDGIPKIEMPYGDYYLADTAAVILDCVSFYGWMLFLAFALISLIVKGIRAIVRKIKKSKKKIMLGKTTGFIAITELLLGLCGLGVILSISAWLPHTIYMWFFYAVGVLTVILAALVIFSIFKFITTPRKESSVIRKIYNVVSIAGAVLTVFFVIYMQLWHW